MGLFASGPLQSELCRTRAEHLHVENVNNLLGAGVGAGAERGTVYVLVIGQ